MYSNKKSAEINQKDNKLPDEKPGGGHTKRKKKKKVCTLSQNIWKMYTKELSSTDMYKQHGLSSAFYRDTQGKHTEHIVFDTNWLPD